MDGTIANSCLLVSEKDVLGLLLPYCRNLMVIIINVEACEFAFDWASIVEGHIVVFWDAG